MKFSTMLIILCTAICGFSWWFGTATFGTVFFFGYGLANLVNTFISHTENKLVAAKAQINDDSRNN